MIKIIRRFHRHIRVLQKKEMVLFALLGGFAFLKSSLISLWTARVLSLFQSQSLIYSLPNLFLISGFLSIFIGYWLFRMKTRISPMPFYVAIGVAFFTAVINKTEWIPILFGLSLPSVCLLIEGVFRNMSARFVPQDFDSHRYWLITMAEMSGYIGIGILSVLFPVGVRALFEPFLAAFCLLVGGLLFFPRLNKMFPRKSMAKDTSLYSFFYRGTVLFYTAWVSFSFFLFAQTTVVFSVQQKTEKILSLSKDFPFYPYAESLFLRISESAFSLTTMNFALFGCLGCLCLILFYLHRSFERIWIGCGLLFLSFTLVSQKSYGMIFVGQSLVAVVTAFFFRPYFAAFRSVLIPSRRLYRLLAVESIYKPLGVILSAVCLQNKAGTEVLLGMGLFIFLSGLIGDFSRMALIAFRRHRPVNALVLQNQSVWRFMKKNSQHKSASSVLYFLNMMAHAKHPQLENMTELLLTHPAESVRNKALENIRKYKMTKVLKVLPCYVEKEKSDFVKQEMMRLLLVDATPSEKARLKSEYGQYDFFCKAETMASLEHADLREKALSEIKSLALSVRKKDRIEAAFMIRKGRFPVLTDSLIALLNDDCRDVVREALKTAPYLWNYQVFCAVLSMEREDQQRFVLSQMIDKSLPFVLKYYRSASENEETDILLLDLICRLETEELKPFLYRLFPVLTLNLRVYGLKSLYERGYLSRTSGERNLFGELFKRSLKEAEFLEEQKELLSQKDFCLAYPKSTDQFYQLALKIKESLLYSVFYAFPYKILRESTACLIRGEEESFDASAGIMEDILKDRDFRIIRRILLDTKNISLNV